MRAGLAEAQADPDPLRQFERWFDDALRAKLPLPNAMTLATAGAGGVPSARMVLLRGVDQRGFVFYTNYESRKAAELAANPRAALVFWWGELQRQVRVEGPVERTSQEESAAYWRTRPPGSRLSAWASPQSRVIPGRAVLDERVAELAALDEPGRRAAMAAEGWVTPHLPRPWGRAAAPLEQVVIQQEMRRAKVSPVPLVIGAWVVTSYLCATAVVAPLTGWLRRRFGGQLLFIGAVGAFAAAYGR